MVDPLTEALAGSGKWRSLFATIVLVRDGEINAAVSAIAKSNLVFLQSSWNVRLLASSAADVCKAYRIPLVTGTHTTSHSSPEACSRLVQREWLVALLGKSDRVVCVSESVRESIAPFADALRRPPLVIENASRFRPSDRRRFDPAGMTVTT